MLHQIIDSVDAGMDQLIALGLGLGLGGSWGGQLLLSFFFATQMNSPALPRLTHSRQPSAGSGKYFIFVIFIMCSMCLSMTLMPMNVVVS